VGRVPAYEQAETLGEGVQDPVVALHRDPLPQQAQHARGLVEEPDECFGRRPAHTGVPVRDEGGEELGSRADGGIRRPGPVTRFRGLLRSVSPSDTDQKFHQPAPVRDLFASGEYEQKRNAGERRVVHDPLVVHRAVHPVERARPLGGVGGGQSPEESGHVLGTAVRMAQ